MSNNKLNAATGAPLKKTCLMFDETGDIIVSYYSPFGEREERVLDANDSVNMNKYVDYLSKCGFSKMLDKYNFFLYFK